MTKHGIVKNVRGASEEAKGQSEIRPQTKKRKKKIPQVLSLSWKIILRAFGPSPKIIQMLDSHNFKFSILLPGTVSVNDPGDTFHVVYYVLIIS
jgi:hypothetical protein